MGHAEMRLAVAGLDQNAVAERCRLLAAGDWTALSPDERVAYGFAAKQAETPAAITQLDFQGLVRQFGEERALDVLWWSCRCHYMTRVADAFQLPLEKQNVFDGFLPAEAPEKAP
jgi:alkylhydroperoxidase family enzyme